MNKENEIKIAERIRNQYIHQEETKFDQLKKIDKNVKRPAKTFAYIFGIIGSLVMGLGMSLAMKIILDMMIVGIVIGCVGITMVCVNYPIYNLINRNRKIKYSEQVLKISNELLNK